MVFILGQDVRMKREKGKRSDAIETYPRREVNWVKGTVSKIQARM